VPLPKEKFLPPIFPETVARNAGPCKDSSYPRDGKDGTPINVYSFSGPLGTATREGV